MDVMLQRLTIAMNRRRNELQRVLERQVNGREKSLAMQLSALRGIHALHNTARTRGTMALEHTDAEVIRCKLELESTPTPAVTVPSLQPVASSKMQCLMDDHGALDHVCSTVLASIGRVGIDPPMLQGYDDDTQTIFLVKQSPHTIPYTMVKE